MEKMLTGAFGLPRYQEIPGVGLYLKQVVKFINEITETVFYISVTETMLSNYVKKHLVSSPVKKQYDRDQIAALLFIVLAKTVVSLDDIQMLLMIREEKYTPQEAYDYFCSEFEQVIQSVYGSETALVFNGSGENNEKQLLRNIIITMAHKFYLEECFRGMREKG